jgi:hypothetical protein
MQKAFFWNKLYIQGCKIAIFLGLFLSFLKPGLSQSTVKINDPNYDKRRLHYGFLVGIHSAAYKLRYSRKFLDSASTPMAINPRFTAGFSLGFIVSYSVGEYFDLRLLPSVGFYDYDLSLEYMDPAKNRITSASKTFVEFSALVKYRSVRRKNHRFYIVGGFKPGIEVTPKTDEYIKDELDVENTNLSVEYGVGVDIYYPLFKFSPEIRFSHGLNDMIAIPNDVSRGIKKLTTHSISINLIFQ